MGVNPVAVRPAQYSPTPKVAAPVRLAPPAETDTYRASSTYEKARVNFGLLLKGVGRGEAMINELFDEIWKLAENKNGGLKVDKWNELMKKYKLEDYIMNPNSFEALWGSKNGKRFSNDEKGDEVVESGAELDSALASLIKTMQINIQLTGDEDLDSEQANKYAAVFSGYCKAKSFNIINLADFSRVVIQALGLGKDGKGISLADLPDDAFAGRLRSLAGSLTEWDDFLTALLFELEKALAEGFDGEAASQKITERLTEINSILKKGPDDPSNRKQWDALVEQLGNLFLGKMFDYNNVVEGIIVGSGKANKVDDETREGGRESWSAAPISE